MRSICSSGASAAPSPEILRRSRVLARGVPGHLVGSVLDLCFAAPKRDDVVALAAVTASRIAACTRVRS